MTLEIPPAESDRPVAGQDLRRRTVRGTLINGTFLISTNGLSMIRGLVVARLLTAADFGVWGILVGITTALMFFKRVGFGDKYVQQDEEDQELEFQRMMTLELALGLTVMVLGAIAMPLLALAYGADKIVAPGLCMMLLMPALALQAPIYLFYRRMDFVRQRTLQIADPVVGFVATVVLAIAGLGYWALVAGTLIGAWTGAVVIMRATPYRLRWRFDRESLLRYSRFTGPLLLNGLAAIVIAQSLLLASQHHLGLAAVGAITLVGTINQFVGRADDIITNTLFPAICAAIDRPAVLLESFVKSNRLVLMWAVPFGAGLALFAADLVHFGLGDKWAPAIILLQTTAVGCSIHQIGFNWDAFYRASGRTGPIGWSAIYGIVVCLSVTLPMIFAFGLKGIAWGTLIIELLLLAQRTFMLHRFFPGFRMWRHVVRGIVPTVPAAAVVLVPRALGLVEHTLPAALGFVAVYVVTTLAFTVLFERELLGEVLGHMRRRRAPAAA